MLSTAASTWDAIVVGGGPAGSTAAWDLARRGARVLVLDAARFPRVKLCAGWVTPAVWQALELAPADYPHTLQPFSRVTLALDAEVRETCWDTTAGYGIVRSEFDAHLLERARRAGATVREGARVDDLDLHDRRMVVRSGGLEDTAPLVIGAGGHHCPVARRFGAIATEEAVVVARESETHVGAAVLRGLTPRHGTPELFVEPDFRGYGWTFTKGDFLNVGIGALTSGRDLHARCDRMVERLHADGRLPASLEIQPFKGHAYAIQTSHPRRIAGPGFLLAGDAAGLARGISGEGIGPAIESGLLAARAVAEHGSDAPGTYPQLLRSRLRHGRQSALGRLADRLPHAWVEHAARCVVGSAALRRRWILEGAFGMRPSHATAVRDQAQMSTGAATWRETTHE